MLAQDDDAQSAVHPRVHHCTLSPPTYYPTNPIPSLSPPSPLLSPCLPHLLDLAEVHGEEDVLTIVGHDVIWDSMLEDLRLGRWPGGRRGERDRERERGGEKREKERGNVSTTGTLILFIRGK